MIDAPSDQACPSYVAAFRTHVWDPAVANMAARMHAHCRRGRFVVLADETAGRLHVPGYEKVAHSVDLSGIGIPAEPPHGTLWYSGDHALYVLLHALPRHDYYLVSEYDVQVNADLDAIMASVAARKLDLVAAQLRRADQDWAWRPSTAAWFEDPWAILFAFVIVSRRALERLYAERLAHAALFRQGTDRPWAHCEGFVPSVLQATPGMACADLAEFVRLPVFSDWDSQLIGSRGLDERGTLFHPVHGRDRIIERCFRRHPATDYLDSESYLHLLLQRFDFDDVLPHLRDALLREGNHAGMERLEARLRGEPWEDPVEAARRAADLARGKPATQSSIVSPWSHGATVEADANRVVAPELAEDFANHTDEEEEPWWQVDLGAPHAIHEVEVLNRALFVARARLTAYFLRGSLDGKNWFFLHFRPFGEPVSGQASRPESIPLPDRPVVRYVRLQLPGRGLLHLRRVRVFGTPVTAEAVAPWT